MLKKKTIMMVLRSVNVNRGGITKATIKRANFLSNIYNKVIIVTTLFQQNHKWIVEELYRTKQLSTKVQVINFYEELKQAPGKRLFRRNPLHKVTEKDLVEVEVPDHPEKSYRYYKDGLFIKYKRFDKKGNLKFVDYMEGKSKGKREEFDPSGNLVRIREMDTVVNKPYLDRYFDINGDCFLSNHIHPESEQIYIVQQFGKQLKTYNNILSIQEKWLEKEIEKHKEVVLISEQREMDLLIKNNNNPKLKKIIMIHSSHLSKPFDNINKIRPSYKALYNWISNIDAIVFLTQEQKDDYELILGKSDKIKIIPHAFDNNKSGGPKKINKNPYHAVSIARYSPEKRLDDMIKAFKYVVDKIPNARLDLYGGGPSEKELEKIINSLNLSKNIFLRGYTNDPVLAYKSASCSILTSIREGFGMVITESMAVGTPVVAYNVKYGPKDIIQNDVNGFIVENGNSKELAEKIISIMKNSELRDRLSKNALQIRENFSEKKYKENWVNLIESL